MTERIEGEFHYATPVSSSIVGNPPVWSIFRSDDDEKVWARACSVITVESHMGLLDRAARHFTAGGEEKKAREIDEAADKIATGETWRSFEVKEAEGYWFVPGNSHDNRHSGLSEALHAASSEGENK